MIFLPVVQLYFSYFKLQLANGGLLQTRKILGRFNSATDYLKKYFGQALADRRSVQMTW
jgi:hypothetical protein